MNILSNDNLNEDSILSVRTPWGNLAKSQGIQTMIDSLKNDLALMNKRIRDIEKEKNGTSTSNQPSESVIKALADFETRIKQVENKMSDLDSKFEKFSTKTLQILEQLRKGTF